MSESPLFYSVFWGPPPKFWERGPPGHRNFGPKRSPPPVRRQKKGHQNWLPIIGIFFSGFLSTPPIPGGKRVFCKKGFFEFWFWWGLVATPEAKIAFPLGNWAFDGCKPNKRSVFLGFFFFFRGSPNRAKITVLDFVRAQLYIFFLTDIHRLVEMMYFHICSHINFDVWTIVFVWGSFFFFVGRCLRGARLACCMH